MEAIKWNYFLFSCLHAAITFYKWPSSTATCVRPEVNDPDIALIDDLSIYEDATIVILFCDTSLNYVGYGPVAIYCAVDTWIPDPSQRECKAPCDAPIVTTGVLHYDAETGKTEDVYLHDMAVQFACEDTESTTLYHDRGLEKTICTDGSWDYNHAPICAKNCEAPLNAIPSGLFQHMSKVTFTCESGFQPVGPTTLDCSDGQWNNVLICEAIPSDVPTEATKTEPPQAEQTTMTTKQPATTRPPIVCDFPDTTKLDPDAIVTPMQDGYPLFSIIELSCGGTELTTSDGPKRFACYYRGVWLPSPEDFKCYRPCNAPQASANVDYITMEGQNLDELYSHNAVIGFGCSSAKQLLYGASLASCYDGEWNPEQAPTCEDVNAFELTFQVTHIYDSLAIYQSDYADRESQTFLEMETEVVHAIGSIYTMLDGYLLSKIVSFSDPGTSGLDVYAVAFVDKSSVSGTLERITDETKTTLSESATIDGLSLRFTLDDASVLVTEPCEVPDLHEDIAFESSDDPLELLWYPYSTTFTLSCREEGYIFDGPLELTCENGDWVPDGEPLCIEMQTTPTTDRTETLRQTTSSTDDITTMAQTTQSTVVRTDTPTVQEMSSPVSSSSTLAPEVTTNPLPQTISSVTVSEMTTGTEATQATTFPSKETSKFQTTQVVEITATEKSASTVASSTKNTDRADFTTMANLDSTASAFTLTGAEGVTTSKLFRTDATAPTAHEITITDKATSSELATDFTRSGIPTSFTTTGMPLGSTGIATSADLDPTEEVGITGTGRRTDFSATILSVSPTLTQPNGISPSLDVSEPTRFTTMTPQPPESTFLEPSATTLTEMATHLLTTNDEISPKTSSWTIGDSTSVTTANTDKDVTTNGLKPSTDESNTITSLPKASSGTITDIARTNELTDVVSQSYSTSQTTLVSVTGSSESSDVTPLYTPSTSILTPETFTSVPGTTTASVTEQPISVTKIPWATPKTTTDSISATSATTYITKFHATIEATESSRTEKTTVTTEIGNGATSQTATYWVLTTIGSTDENTEKHPLPTFQLPTDVTYVADNTDHTTGEHFQKHSEATPTQRDNPTTSEAIYETTEGILETSSHFTSYSRVNTDGLTSSKDKTDNIQTSEDASTSPYSDTSMTIPTESADFTIVTVGSMFTTDEEQGTSALVTDGPLTTFPSATTPESLEQTTHISEHQTNNPIITSREENQDISTIETKSNTVSNKEYSAAILSSGTSRNFGTMVSTTTTTTTVDLETTDMANEGTSQPKATGWEITTNSLSTENVFSSTTEMVTTDERTTEFISLRPTSKQSTGEIKQTTDEIPSSKGIPTTAQDLTSQMISTRTSSKQVTTAQSTTDNVAISQIGGVTSPPFPTTTTKGVLSTITLTYSDTDKPVSSTMLTMTYQHGSSKTPSEWMLTSPAKQSTENALTSDIRGTTSAIDITSADLTTAGENEGVTTESMENTEGPSTFSTVLKMTSSEKEFTENALTSDIRSYTSAIDITSAESTTAGENEGVTTESTKKTDGFSTTLTELKLTSPEKEFTENALTSDIRTTMSAVESTSVDLTTKENNKEVTTEATKMTDGSSSTTTEKMMTSKNQFTDNVLTSDGRATTSKKDITSMDFTTVGETTLVTTETGSTTYKGTANGITDSTIVSHETVEISTDTNAIRTSRPEATESSIATQMHTRGK